MVACNAGWFSKRREKDGEIKRGRLLTLFF